MEIDKDILLECICYFYKYTYNKVIGGDYMVEIMSKDNKRYVIDNIEHKSVGVIFYINNELVFLSHKDIKSINLNYMKVSAKTYIKS